MIKNCKSKLEEKNKIILSKNEDIEFSEAFFNNDSKLVDISKAIASNYYVIFSKFPNLIYNVQSFNLPSITNNAVRIPRPQGPNEYYVAGHTTNYDEFGMTIFIDENFRNYFEILKWMRENQYKNYFKETVSNATLVILNNAKVPIIRIDISEVLPSTLGELDFQNQNSAVITSYISFYCHTFRVKYLDGSNFIA